MYNRNDAENYKFEQALKSIRTTNIASNQQELVDIDGDIVYIGYARQGFGVTEGSDNDNTKPNWLIQKINIGTITFTTKIGYGIWNNRKTTVTYS